MKTIINIIVALIIGTVLVITFILFNQTPKPSTPTQETYYAFVVCTNCSAGTSGYYNCQIPQGTSVNQFLMYSNPVCKDCKLSNTLVKYYK